MNGCICKLCSGYDDSRGYDDPYELTPFEFWYKWLDDDYIAELLRRHRDGELEPRR